MPTFSAPDYVHLKQQNSNATLSSALSDGGHQGGSNDRRGSGGDHHNMDSNNQSSPATPVLGPSSQLQDSMLDDRVYLADDGVVIGEPIIVNFRDRKPWGAWPCHQRLKVKKIVLALLIFLMVVCICVGLLLAVFRKDSRIDEHNHQALMSTHVVLNFSTLSNQWSRSTPLPLTPSRNTEVVVENNTRVCTSASCVKAAASLLAAIDRSVDPCDNFFDYACGQWNKDHPIPDDMPAYGTFAYVRDLVKQQLRSLLEEPISKNQSNTDPVKMAKIFYRNCMNTSYINKLKSKPLLPILQEFNGWPLLNKSWSPSDVDITRLLATLRKDYGLELFLTLFVYADSKNTSSNILTIDKGSLGLGSGSRDYYLNDTMYGNQISAYKRYINDIVALLAHDMNLEMTNETFEDTSRILEFERELAEITTPEDQRRNHSLMYNKWSLANLTNQIDIIDWHRMFETIMPDEVYNVTRQPGYRLIISEPKYMKDLDNLLKTTDKRVLFNYIIWRFVKSWSKVLDTRFDDIFQVCLLRKRILLNNPSNEYLVVCGRNSMFKLWLSMSILSHNLNIPSMDFAQVMLGRQQKPVRWKICVPAAVTSFDMAAGAMYIREYFKQEDKVEAVSMIKYIQEAFRGLVSELDWMDNVTKVTAVEKAAAMLNHIGYPEFILNKTALDDYYAGLMIDRKMTYFDMNRKITQWMHYKDISDLLKPFDRNKFDTSPAIVNAFYSPEKNAITFPAGILQPPFFKGDYPKSINYGAMGAVIGHEITHGFDDQGSQYDKNGNLKDWWSPAAFEGFQERTKCIIEQYGNYSVPDIKLKKIYVNGKLTQGENIADNGGVKEAFRAYRKYISEIGDEEPRLPGLQDLSNEQLFFLSYANFWCGHKKPAASLQQVLTDPHSPEMFRVIGVLSNLDEFSKAFNCKPGTTMNPDPHVRPKCRVW